MGGPLPLGYNLNGRKLIINKKEAQEVKDIYTLYLELKSVKKLYEYLNKQGYKMKQWKTKKGETFGGSPYTKHSVRTVLSNAVYIGKIAHKGKLYDGEQDSIINTDLWDKVQSQLQTNTHQRSTDKNAQTPLNFTGKIVDAQGNLYLSTYTKKGNKRYHYYINKETKERINAKAFHDTVQFALETNQDFIMSLNIKNLTIDETTHRYKNSLETIIKQAIEKVVIHKNKFSIFINKTSVKNIIQRKEVTSTQESELHEISIDMLFKSYEGRKSILLNGHQISHKDVDIKRHENMVKLIVAAFKLSEKFKNGTHSTIKEFAETENIGRTYLSDLLKLRRLSPEIIEMIFKSQSPTHLNASKLIGTKLPRCWQKQKEAFALN